MWCPVRALLIVNPNATSTTPAARDLLAHALESRMQSDCRAHPAPRPRRRTGAVGCRQRDGPDRGARRRRHRQRGDQRVSRRRPRSMSAARGRPQIAVCRAARRTCSPGRWASTPTRRRDEPADRPARRRRSTAASGSRHCDDRWFTFNAGLGLDAMCARRSTRSRDRGHTATPVRYVRTAVRDSSGTNSASRRCRSQASGRRTGRGRALRIRVQLEPLDISEHPPDVHQPRHHFRHRPRALRHADHVRPTTLRVAANCCATGAKPKSPRLVRRDDVPCEYRCGRNSRSACRSMATSSGLARLSADFRVDTASRSTSSRRCREPRT